MGCGDGDAQAHASGPRVRRGAQLLPSYGRSPARSLAASATLTAPGQEGYWDSIFQNPNGNTGFFPACKAQYNETWIRDLWLANGTYEGPAFRDINTSASCSVGVHDLCDLPSRTECPPYPGFPNAEVPRCTYVDETFADSVVQMIEAHDPTVPLFLFWAPHTVHTPLQVPAAYLDKFGFIPDWRRRRYHAMVSYMDDRISNVVDALTRKGMLGDSAIFFSADNGGPIYDNGAGGANNYPLRGGKASSFEGGIRVNAFVSGGAVPEHMRGSKLQGLSTIWGASAQPGRRRHAADSPPADWYATFASGIAGLTDIEDKAALEAGVPPLDSLNLWPYITGRARTSPRTEVAVGTGNGEVDGLIKELDGGLYKILLGPQSCDGWTGPQCPNASYRTPPTGKCAPCFFRLDTDPTEHNDLANSTEPAAVAAAAALTKRVNELEETSWAPDRGTQDPVSCLTAMGKYAGFWGPWISV